MPDNSTVSILIHNINRASALEVCLQSVLQQRYRPIEVVLLDAGSTDDSAAVIARMTEDLVRAGIQVQMHNCPLMGVAASRNLAARLATGEFICAIDNDAAYTSPDDIGNAVKLLETNRRSALVTFRFLRGNTEEMDTATWVYRRSREWANRTFDTFTFVGGAFCIRAEAFWKSGGFWDALRYSREEEELAFALVNDSWRMIYTHTITIRHYSDPRGRYATAEKKKVELRNGLLVLWRRIPLPIALLACLVRIGSMLCGAIARRSGVVELLRAIPDAIHTWRHERLVRSPISFVAAWRYVALHFSGGI